MKMKDKHILNALNSLLLTLKEIGTINQEQVREITDILMQKRMDKVKSRVENKEKQVYTGFNGIKLDKIEREE